MKTKISALQRALLFVLVGGLWGTAVSTFAQTTTVYDLNTDWSDTANPNGVWRYRAGTTLMHGQTGSPHVPAGQVVWVGPDGYLPIAFKYDGADWREFHNGDVYVHSANSDGEGVANILWTAPSDGTIDVSGAAWFMDDPNLAGRSSVWSLWSNGVLLTSGMVSSSDAYDRSSPFNFSLGSGGAAVLQGVPVSTGDELMLQVRKESGTYGTYVGLNWTIALTTETEAVVCTPAPAGLVSWWRGEGDAQDNVGDNHGMLQNGASFAPGKVGQGFSLNGANQYVLIGDPVPASLQIQNEITLSAWIYATAYPAGNLGLIIGSQYDTRRAGATIFLDGRTNPDGQPSPPGHIHFQIGDGSSWHTSNADAPVPLDRWVHIVATRRANEDAKIYYNGVLQPVTSVPWSGSISYDGAWFAIGQQRDINRPFNGLIDEADIYNRALTAAEVQAIYDAGAAGKCVPAQPCTPVPSGAVAWWRAEENALDSVDAHNGSLQNGTTFATGKVGQAFNFDGANDYVDLGNWFNLQIFSVALWVKAGAVQQTHADIIDNNHTDFRSWVVQYQNTGLSFAWGIAQRGGVVFDLTPDTWQFLVMTFDSDYVGRLYLDGALVGSFNGNGPPIYDGTEFLRLSRWGGGGRHFNGQIDEVDIYSHALTAAEIQAIYAAGSAGKCTDCTPVVSGLTSWWQAEGSASDALGVNNGSGLGGTYFTPAVVGSGFAFDSNDDGVTISHNTSLDVSDSGFTVDFWMKGIKNQPESVFAAIDKSHGAVDSAGWVFQGDNSSGSIAFIIGKGGAGTTDFAAVGSVVDVLDGSFHHVAGTWASGELRLYVDGVSQGATPVSAPANNTRPLNLGYFWNGGGSGRHFRGVLDEVKLYHRALSSQEIAHIYNCQTVCQPPSLTTESQGQSVCSGAAVTFTSSASGTPPLSYQWSRNGMDITGATSPTLTINPATGGDAGDYRVRVVNACGSVESSVAVLNVETTVCAPPPTGITAWWPAEGNANDLVQGDHGIPENGPDFVSGRVGQAFSFAGDDRIRFNSMFELHQPRDASIEFWLKFNPTSHQCLFWTRPDNTDANRFNISINGDSTLQVDYRAPSGALHLLGFGAPVPPNTWSHVAIVRAENVYTIFVNGSASASRVDASPDLPNTVGWQLSGRGGFHVVAELDELSSYNRALTPAEVQALHASGCSGKCPSTCFAPAIVTGPASQNVCLNATVTFTALAVGTEPITYQWLKEGVEIAGATSPTLNISAVTTTDTGSYRVRVGNACGQVESSAATLAAHDSPPAVTLNGPSSVTVEACVGSYTELGAAASDDCDGSLPVVTSGDPVNPTQPGTYVISYSATDSSGQTATATRTVIVADTRPPVFTVTPSDLTVTCSSDGAHQSLMDAWLASAAATDECNSVAITHSLAWSGPCNQGSAVVTWTARDQAGNSATASATLTVLPDETLADVSFVESVQSVLLPLNASQQSIARVTNSGTCPTLITGVVVRTDFAAPTLAVDPSFTVPFTICPDSIVEIPVNIDSSGALAGSYAAVLELRSNDEDARASALLNIDVNSSRKPDPSFNALGAGLRVSFAPTSIVPMPGDPLTLIATLKNVGSAAAGPFSVDFLEGLNALGSQPVAGLAVGATTTVQLELPNGFPAAGFYIIRAQINSPSGGELSLANNLASAVLQVGFLDISGAAIVIEASASVDCNGLGYISGRAHYEILSGSHVLTFPVQGGFGTLTIDETGKENSGWHTLTDGSFSVRVSNLTTDPLHARVHITDFSLEREKTLLIPALVPCVVVGGEPGQPGIPPPDLPPAEIIDLSVCSGDIGLYHADQATPVAGPVIEGETVWIEATVHYYNSLGNALANQVVEFSAILPGAGGDEEFLIGTALVSFSGGGTATAGHQWSPPKPGEFAIRARLLPTVAQNDYNDTATRALLVGSPPPGVNSILVTASGYGCGLPVVSVNGSALYGSIVEGAPHGVPVVCGDVTAILFDSAGQQLAVGAGAHTDVTGIFRTGIPYSLSPGDYRIRVEVTDGTMTGATEFTIHCEPPGPAPNTPPNVSGDFYVFAEDVAFLGPDCLSSLFRAPMPGETISVGGLIHYFGNTAVTHQRVIATVLVPNGDHFDAVPIGEQFVDFPESGSAFTCFNWTPLVPGPQIVQVKVEPTVPFSEFGGNNAATRVISIGEHQCRLGIAPAQAVVHGGQSIAFTVEGQSFSDLNPTLALSVIAGADNQVPAGMTTVFSPAALTLPGSATLTVSVTHETPAGIYSLLLVGRNDQCADIEPFEITVVQNEPPSLTVAAPGVTVGEGSAAVNGGTWGDADGDAVTFTASVGTVTHDGATWAWNYTPLDETGESGTVTITADDGHDGVASVTFELVVSNVAPRVTIQAPASGFISPVNVPIGFAGSFVDPGVADTHTAYWVLSSLNVPETMVAATIDGANITDEIAFPEPGVYNIRLVVTDNDGGIGEATTVNDDLPAYVVVFDPSGGHVTGGGWIWSPAGALHPELQAFAEVEGRATFGFVAKYQAGAAVPTGNTEFQFKAGDLNFHSHEYQWLVVAGARAQYKGSGTINQSGSYGFLLTVMDGQLSGGGGDDRLRMKIWDAATGVIIYDNQAGDDDDASLVDGTILRGGSIVIHKN